MTVLIATSVKYFSQRDEDSFFAWLNSIDSVTGAVGVGRDLRISLKASTLPDGDLREFVALFFRYGVDMRQLGRFLTDSNASWFAEPEKYWHDAVFGK